MEVLKAAWENLPLLQQTVKNQNVVKSVTLKQRPQFATKPENGSKWAERRLQGVTASETVTQQEETHGLLYYTFTQKCVLMYLSRSHGLLQAEENFECRSHQRLACSSLRALRCYELLYCALYMCVRVRVETVIPFNNHNVSKEYSFIYFNLFLSSVQIPNCFNIPQHFKRIRTLQNSLFMKST